MVNRFVFVMLDVTHRYGLEYSIICVEAFIWQWIDYDWFKYVVTDELEFFYDSHPVVLIITVLY
jgi:hypothetical protein